MSLLKIDMNEDNIWDAVIKPIVFYVVLGYVAIFIMAYFAGKKFCLDSYAQYSPQYGFFTDCRIVYDGKLTPVEMVKNINVNPLTN